MKTFKGKAIYQPAGKAKEYAEWACNFYVGCSNGCDYCYLKKGRGAAILGGNVPTLKKCFKDEVHALEVFEMELKANLPELQKHGLFFSFSTDPMLPETIAMTYQALVVCSKFKIPVKILTKVEKFIDLKIFEIDGNKGCSIFDLPNNAKCNIAFGFTLTGHDELEPGASTNQERIEAMKKLHDAGFKTFASIEPVIDFKSSIEMIVRTAGICDLLKIGLESGKKYDKNELFNFMNAVIFIARRTRKVYFKDSLLKAAWIERSELPANCVNRDYNIFKEL
ncbi:MAG: hypothetical protein A2X18_07595 [Bacteroidetes bacterium GWF2_40_14]|nr:MAG: hypothetical protein A2X18_07595 [Bacteroidetes bacterium GWF2_40_14]